MADSSSSGCCNCGPILPQTGVFSWTFAKAVRAGHVLLVCSLYGLAILLGKIYPSIFDGTFDDRIDFTGDCDTDYLDYCIYRQVIYRASLALMIVFTILSIATPFSKYLHWSMWTFKVVISYGLFFSFWFVGNTTFSLWAQVARHMAVFWLIIQALLLFDLVFDIHEYMIDEADYRDKQGLFSTHIYVLYIFFCIVGLVSSIVGIYYLFEDYSGCYIGLAFTSVTLALGVITTVLSLWSPINRGFLSPCIMFAYCVFKCWYALLSDPVSACNLAADDNDGLQIVATVIMGVITGLVTVYVILSGSKLLNAFDLSQGEGVLRSYVVKTTRSPKTSRSNSFREVRESQDAIDKREEWRSLLVNSSGKEPEGFTRRPSANVRDSASSEFVNRDSNEPQGTEREDWDRISIPTETANDVDDQKKSIEHDSGTTPERLYFHIFMCLSIMYAAMFVTNWGSTSGAPNDYSFFTEAQAYESMWVKISSQWVFFVLHFRALQVAYEDNKNQFWNFL